MMSNEPAEYWLRGALPDIHPLLQPVAHALLQAQMEIKNMMADFPDEYLWEKPAGVASPAFHLQHIAGILQRLFTYADGRQLTAEQLRYLSLEGKKNEAITLNSLLSIFEEEMQEALAYLKLINPQTLIEVRFVGRQKIPSTQIGLLFHAAEHTMRHTGQLSVTVKVILSNKTLEK